MVKLKREDGYSYMTVIIMLAVMAIGAGVVYQPESKQRLQLQEKLLASRANSYVNAIYSFYFLDKDNPQMPETIDQLLRDPRQNISHLRRLSNDPLEDLPFAPIVNARGYVIGVRPTTNLKPQSQLAGNYQNLVISDKDSYQGWEFMVNCDEINCEMALQ